MMGTVRQVAEEVGRGLNAALPKAHRHPHHLAYSVEWPAAGSQRLKESP
jgi:hypothetical protein